MPVDPRTTPVVVYRCENDNPEAVPTVVGVDDVGNKVIVNRPCEFYLESRQWQVYQSGDPDRNNCPSCGVNGTKVSAGDVDTGEKAGAV